DRCGATLGGDDKYAGHIARCAQCSAEIAVPQRNAIVPKTPRWPFFRSIVRARVAQRRWSRRREKRAAMHAALAVNSALPSQTLPRLGTVRSRLPRVQDWHFTALTTVTIAVIVS